MKSFQFTRGTGHLLFKIFSIYLVTAIVVISTVAALLFSFSPKQRLPPSIEKNLALYIEFLDQKFGTDNSEESFVRIQQDLGLLVRTSKNTNWSDKNKIPEFEEIEKVQVGSANEIFYGHIRKYLFAYRPQLGHSKIWFLKMDDLPHNLRWPFASVAAILLLILSMSFFSVHLMLMPLRVLMKGVGELSRGNLKYRLPNLKRKEFRLIAETFNSLADRIEQLIAGKERLLRDVSHELRSPLTRMQVAADLLDDSDWKKQIKLDIQKMDTLLREVLETFRLHGQQPVLQFSQVDVYEFLNDIIRDYNLTNEVVTLTSPRDQIKAEFDSLQVERVLRNLIDNAVKYSKESLKSIEVSVRIEGALLIFGVRDNGVGISASDLPHLFEPFYRGDKARSHESNGFGLGLSICKSIALAHKGDLTVRSIEGQETLFELRIPRSPY